MRISLYRYKFVTISIYSMRAYMDIGGMKRILMPASSPLGQKGCGDRSEKEE